MNNKEALEHKLDGTSPRPVQHQRDVGKPHPKQQEAMEVFARFERNRNMGMAIDIAGVSAQLKVAPTAAQFPEELFVQFFLPMFTGEVAPTLEINIRTWIEKVSGGELNPVEIIDGEGKTLFTVPPLFDTSILEQSKPGGSSMTHVERQYSRLKEIDVRGSQNFLAKTLSGMHVKEKPTAEVYVNMRMWNWIFERYGKGALITTLLDLENDPNKNNPITTTGASNADVGDYELDTD